MLFFAQKENPFKEETRTYPLFFDFPKSNKYNMEKKVIDLGIIPELEVSGVKKISLVEEPAIELDFLYFKKEEFVTPNAGESDDEFISRCIPVLIGEGKEEDQAAAICYSYLEMEIDTSNLTPYVENLHNYS